MAGAGSSRSSARGTTGGRGWRASVLAAGARGGGGWGGAVAAAADVRVGSLGAAVDGLALILSSQVLGVLLNAVGVPSVALEGRNGVLVIRDVGLGAVGASANPLKSRLWVKRGVSKTRQHNNEAI